MVRGGRWGEGGKRGWEEGSGDMREGRGGVGKGVQAEWGGGGWVGKRARSQGGQKPAEKKSGTAGSTPKRNWPECGQAK